MPEIQNFLKPLPSASGNPSYDNRLDGSAKGEGWYGALPMLDNSGNVATELSTTFNYGKGDVLVPLINPMLTPVGERPVVMITDTADPSLLYRYPIVLRKEKTRLYSLASEEEKEKQWLKYK